MDVNENFFNADDGKDVKVEAKVDTKDIPVKNADRESAKFEIVVSVVSGLLLLGILMFSVGIIGRQVGGFSKY